MPGSPAGVSVRVAGPADLAAIAALRALWSEDDPGDPVFERRMAQWLAGDGDRRTVWLAGAPAQPTAGMASMFEYRRMPRPGRPDSRWGYVSNMFVREELRNRGIGTALLAAIVSAAGERGYARLVVSPAERALSFYRRAGFVVPDEAAAPDRLLVHPLAVSPRGALPRSGFCLPARHPSQAPLGATEATNRDARDTPGA